MYMNTIIHKQLLLCFCHNVGPYMSFLQKLSKKEKIRFLEYTNTTTSLDRSTSLLAEHHDFSVFLSFPEYLHERRDQVI